MAHTLLTHSKRHIGYILLQGLLSVLALLECCHPTAVAGVVQAAHGELTIPTYPWWPAVRHPYFGGTDGVKIYPYPMLDFLSREKADRTYRTVVLENEYLRITFLPELGGKVHEVVDKIAGEPMFYVNHVIKPGLIGQCGAWTSGGIEWNTGPQGHTVGCMQPVSVEILPEAPDGSRSVAIGERERIYGTRWTVMVTLRPGRSFIEERIRIYNPTEKVRPYYFWNCTAVPNTPGFQFIYPMRSGTDHGGAVFYSWPMHEGKDLSWGTNYQDAASVFAYGCDQDFFGSYNHDLNRGIVAYADHHQLPGKKAWTWGWGGYGRMHQMDLTDDDGPYNEVQTGPLLTQADVGRLDPHEAIDWMEWWYPVRGLDGFTYANRDLAANAVLQDGGLHLRLMGTGTWRSARVTVRRNGRRLDSQEVSLAPAEPIEMQMTCEDLTEPVQVEVRDGSQLLALFSVPLSLPEPVRPGSQANNERGPSDLAQAGWEQYLFARYSEAETQWNKALDLDPQCVEAHAGLAFLNLGRDDERAEREASAALRTYPDCGPARYALAVALMRQGREREALEAAWLATRDPKSAVAARALVGRALIRRGDFAEADDALAAPGPWQTDTDARNLLAFARLSQGRANEAMALAGQNLEVDPLDSFARSILWLADGDAQATSLASLVENDPNRLLDLMIDYVRLGHQRTAFRLVEQFHLRRIPAPARNPMLAYWAAYLAAQVGGADNLLRLAQTLPGDGVFPHRLESESVLRWAEKADPTDGKAVLYLGHLLFANERHEEGREAWQRAAELGAERALAWRALGMASRTLDDDPAAAADWLARAHDADPSDAIIARDLARVLFQLADLEELPDRKREYDERVKRILKAAFKQGQGRSDFVALLGRAQNRLGQYAETAQLLDSVRITIWEGAREAHDLFEEAHLELGKAHFDAGRSVEALREFNRALDYPENLATGRLETAREAHIQYLRGLAQQALGRMEAAIEAWQKASDEPPSDNPSIDEARRLAKEALEQLRR